MVFVMVMCGEGGCNEGVQVGMSAVVFTLVAGGG
jgi:hypothetical protein